MCVRTHGVWPSTIANFTSTQFAHVRNDHACDTSSETDIGLICAGPHRLCNRAPAHWCLTAVRARLRRCAPYNRPSKYRGGDDEDATGSRHGALVLSTDVQDSSRNRARLPDTPVKRYSVPVQWLTRRLRQSQQQGPATRACHTGWFAKLQRYAELQAQIMANCARGFGTPPFLEVTSEEFNEHRKILRSVTLHKFTERLGDRCPLRGGRLRTGDVRTGPRQFNEILNPATRQICSGGMDCSRWHGFLPRFDSRQTGRLFRFAAHCTPPGTR